ncbi:excinuclease ABC subunit UvrC [Natranaerobius thermophilus]|uniref:UvrABC system protein C n=1 Tax=Natranaerobius thermophilus (strain ATCC BAA-1301 / DSM 18059 / JW/NM-WN-LF) TaxID=457570 RepID=B2A711_NATTJ|nr:excinuclease ABC subunit UvrC [Natranaerobius thermophilus]ACB85602.1 excinuclease ABC, C subunit [Natranaerobius thermophilus JW/NM-WN-LF]
MTREDLQEKLANLPEKPGVYLMKSKQGRVIYVGKAINLKNRVRSYFNSGNKAVKVQVMTPKISDIETIVTDSELEALILENNLIKKYRPKYNVSLRDDKNYPYLKITTEEDYPRLIIARRMGKHGRYFGPYPNAGAVRETIKLLRKLFPVRTCKGETPKNQGKRPCLNYFINRCLAPCNEKVSRDEYREMIQDIISVLEGKEEELLNELERKMNLAAEEMEFEKAAEYRNQKAALEKIRQKQKIVSERREDYDIIALGFEEKIDDTSDTDDSTEEACVQIFYIRGGKLMGRNNFRVSTGALEGAEDMLTSFIKQYYAQALHVPKQILVSHPLTEKELIESWLAEKREGKVEVKVPQRGEKYQLMNMAIKNAELELKQQELESEKERKMTEGALKELALKLSLSEIPFRVEGYDISHTQGEETVASMVVFEGGKSKKKDYRKFRIRTTAGPDDFKAMEEVLRRRFHRAKKEEQEYLMAAETKQDSEYDAREGNKDNISQYNSGTEYSEYDFKFAVLPDLIVIDGGKGQLSSAVKVMEEVGYSQIPVISLAKREEEIFVPERSTSLKFPSNSEALKLLQRIRDEAHRFAVSYHRKSRGKATLTSLLDEVPEIGSRRKKELFEHYSSLNEIKQASIDELANLPSMNKKAAKNLVTYLKGANYNNTGSESKQEINSDTKIESEEREKDD